ncbi:transposase [Streptomyces sp. B1I3]|nr:transposase [Streptomyces sp. B1I3]
MDDRAALRGIVYALRTGVTWVDVPTETIGCSGVTCWRRLRQAPTTPPRSRHHAEDRPQGTAHGTGLGKTRWVVERTFAWLHQFKRLRTRYEIRADLHLGLLRLACSIICLRRLRTSF